MNQPKKPTHPQKKKNKQKNPHQNKQTNQQSNATQKLPSEVCQIIYIIPVKTRVQFSGLVGETSGEFGCAV